jgi:hypothetical protein
LEETVKGPDLCCIVIFRGSWCKYDKHYLRLLGQHHLSHMKKEKCQLIALTSEGPAGAAKADEEWGLTKDYGYDKVLGDDTNALFTWLIEDEVLPNLIIKTPEEAKVQHLITPGTYEHGIVMPGMVWYAHQGNMVFQWTGSFDEADTMPGGPGRPDPEELWQQVVKRKHALDLGCTVMPSHGTDIKLCTTIDEVESEKDR